MPPYQPALPRGYNTYWNNSVLTHVLLPEGFAVSLGFRFPNTGRVLREALIGRFGQSDERVQPGPRSYDGSYTELTLTCDMHEIMVQSAAVNGEQVLLVTPLETPFKPADLLVSAAVLWNMPGYVQHAGDHLTAALPDQTINVYTSGKPVRQMHTGLQGPYLSAELSGAVAVSTGAPMSAQAAAELMAAQKRLVLGQARAYGAQGECYNAMRSCLAWDTIYEPEHRRICSPVSRIWNHNWGGYVLFCWDTYFSALMARPDNKALAYANACAITAEVTEDGFVPNFGAANNDKSRDRSQPPVGSYAVLQIFRSYGETDFAGALFDPLLRWNRWFAQRRMLENGQLCWGSDLYEPVNGKYWELSRVGDTQGAALESGLDNSPMYDNMPFDGEGHIMLLADVGLTGLYILDCESLAALAEALGREEAAELRARTARVKAGLEGLWDEESGIYCNRRLDTGAFEHRYSPTNFYALFSDRVSSEHCDRMLREHFFNPEEFMGEFMLPSIARNDPAYSDQDYWRGRVWAPMNYLVYLALRKHNCKEACRVLAEKSRALLLGEWMKYGHVHENYNADTGEGCDVGSSDRFYHWGALLGLIALMEDGYVA